MEPSGGLTFKELVVRVSKEAGLAYYGPDGSGIALPPINQHDLVECKNVVNDGIRMFIADEPPTGWRWRKRILQVQLTSLQITGTIDSTTDGLTLVSASLAVVYPTDDQLKGYYIYITAGTGKGSWAIITGYDGGTGTVIVTAWADESGNLLTGVLPAAASSYAITPIETVNGDNARYHLPEYFNGSADGTIEYALNTDNVTKIYWVNEAYIRAKWAIARDIAYPEYAAIRPLEPVAGGTMGPRRGFEIIFNAQPAANVVVEFPYTVMFDGLDMEAGVLTAVAGDVSTVTDTERTETDDYFSGWILRIISGTGKGAYGIVTAFASGVFTITWTGTTPDTTSVYVVEPVNNMQPAGQRFDEVILKACLSKASLYFLDRDMPNHYQDYLQKVLPQARLTDARQAPRSLGSMNLNKRTTIYRTWTNVTTRHDIS